MQSPPALAGGSTYNPTTSTSFSSNNGSLDSLNVSTRCGFSPRADHTRCTVSLDTPTRSAIVRHDQCVSPSGVEFFVSSTISSIFDCGIVGFGPRPFRTCPNLTNPSTENRSRQDTTLAG